MANTTGDKLPVEIVTVVIDKIVEFTKEMEIFRQQLPSKESILTRIDAMDHKIDSAITSIKLVFGVIAVIVTLSFLGAQFIDWVNNREDSKKPDIISQEVLDEKLKTQRDEYAKQLDQFQKDILEDIKNLNSNSNTIGDTIDK